jgi:hypothetical protein
MRDHPEFILVDIPELKDFQTRNSAEPDAAERATAARCCRYVQVALQRFEAMCATPDPEFAEPTASDLAEASGKNVRRCELRARNWRHRVYFVEFEDGTLAIAKQSIMDSDAMLRFQYEQLRQLAKLNMRLLIRSRLRKTGFGTSFRATVSAPLSSVCPALVRRGR